MPREIKKMNKEKQIFEIKDCIDAVYGADCAYFDVDGFAIANEIYKKGYRKASDVAEEIFAEINKLAYRFMNDKHYIFGDMINDLYELEKKYTENKK